MKKNFGKENLAKCLVAGLCAILTGCGSIGLAREAAFESAYENTPEEKADIYTSEGYGILKSVDAESGTITVYQLDKKKNMTLSYDGATLVQDRYGSSLVMTQLLPGEIITMRYNDEAGKAGSIMESSDIWTYEDVTRYSIDESRGAFQIGSDTYRISGATKVFSGTEEITMNQILKQDVISLRGTDRDILSIIVKKGHGYLDLENDEELIGGWIEVGQTVIQQISEDMLLTVPEGSYTVRLSIDGIDETREVTIARNKETTLDLSDIEVPKPVSGKAVFTVFPEEANASVFVDGVSVDTSYALILPFGLHQVTASASGYDTISEYFNVEGEMTTVKLTLSEEKESDSTVSGNSSEDEESYHTITVLEPSDVEVYQDNVYMGISPVTYEKKAGSHTITLRRAGYVTKSYQVEVDDDDRDLTYTFADLVPEDIQTVSGNSLASPTPTATVSENKLAASPSPTPTKTPESGKPQVTPSESPTPTPSVTPTAEPTKAPTETPAQEPTPSAVPTQTPAAIPTQDPTTVPTQEPTEIPEGTPDTTPDGEPAQTPALTPSAEPSLSPPEIG